jgi:hypothetical protein
MANTNSSNNVSHATSEIPANFGQVRVHPCEINGQAHIVYPKGLREQAPALFQKLSGYYLAQGYKLKEDQRCHENNNRRKDRRRWAPVVLFTASLLFEGTVSAGIRNGNNNADSYPNQQIELRIVPKQPDHVLDNTDIESLGNASKNNHTILTSSKAEAIFTTLNTHYARKKTDPAYITDDLKQVANYYSQFPQVISLLTPLQDKHWELSYDADNWDTVAVGNMMQVDKAVVHFNTRSAAQLLLNRKCKDNPVCIASPADALLHELLHAYSMLVDTAQFIDQGGMNNVIYPYEHEYAIIDAERKLYASMSNIDDIKRPQRTDHTGRNVLAHCPICIK